MQSFFGLGCGRDELLALPLPGSCAGEGAPLFSQVSAVIMGPGALGPADWEDASTYPAFFQGAGKFLPVTGELPRGVPNRGVVGRPTNGSLIITHRKYTASLAANVRCPEVSAFLLGLQKNWRGFRFWLLTAGGRVIGGARGIKPAYVDAGLEWPDGRDSLERGFLILEWFSTSGADVAYVPALVDDNAGAPGGDTPENMCDMYSQYFSNQSTNSLTWTANGGQLATPALTRVFVFQNGVKLNQSLGQYTVSQGVTTATITINSLTHFPGADYVVFTFI
jgi:hypothetical protein